GYGSWRVRQEWSRMPPRKKTPAPKKASLTDPYLHTRLDRDQMRRVLDEDLQPDAACHSGLGRNPQKPKTAAAINQQGTKVRRAWIGGTHSPRSSAPTGCARPTPRSSPRRGTTTNALCHSFRIERGQRKECRRRSRRAARLPAQAWAEPAGLARFGV